MLGLIGIYTSIYPRYLLMVLFYVWQYSTFNNVTFINILLQKTILYPVNSLKQIIQINCFTWRLVKKLEIMAQHKKTIYMLKALRDIWGGPT